MTTYEGGACEGEGWRTRERRETERGAKGEVRLREGEVRER